MEKLKITSTAIPGIDGVDYLYFPELDIVQVNVIVDAFLPNGKEVMRHIKMSNEEIYVLEVKRLACEATGRDLAKFDKNDKDLDGVYARFLFWKYLIEVQKYSQSDAARTGGGRHRLTVRSSMEDNNTKFVNKKEKAWRDRFNQLLKENLLM